MAERQDAGRRDDTSCLRIRGKQGAGGWVDDRLHSKSEGEFAER